MGTSVTGGTIHPAVANTVSVKLSGVFAMGGVASGAFRFINPRASALFDGVCHFGQVSVTVLTVLTRYIHGSSKTLCLAARVTGIAVQGWKFFPMDFVNRQGKAIDFWAACRPQGVGAMATGTQHRGLIQEALPINIIMSFQYILPDNFGVQLFH